MLDRTLTKDYVMVIDWCVLGENIMREVNEEFQKLYEKRTELFTILITSVIIAFLVNVLTSPLEILVEKITQIFNLPKEVIYTSLMSLLIICLFIIGHFYYGKPVTFRWSTFLLLDKDHGIVYPFHSSVEYSMVGSLALQAYLRDTKSPLFHENSFSLKDPLLRDLLEVFIVDWLVSTTVNKLELLSGFSRPKIKYPKLGKRYKTLKTRDILAKFGENRFAKYLGNDYTIMFSEIKLPEKLIVVCRRYEDSVINIESDEEPLRVPLASELQIKGSRFTPLKRFRIILYVSRIAPGEKCILLASGLRPVVIRSDTIECIDKNGRYITISGEKRKKLSSWIKIDFDVIISAEMRPFLFLHPKFGEVLDWIKKLHLRAIDYFTPKLCIPVLSY